MFDYYVIISMFNRAGISYTLDDSPTKNEQYNEVTITVEAGYAGFISIFHFDKDTLRLKAVDAWE